MKQPTKKGKKFSVVAREYGLSAVAIQAGPSGLRYRTPLERGILWYWFSLYIRHRDKELPCISCGEIKKDCQAGHFIPTNQAAWDDMVFNEYNVHGECPNCNNRDKRKLKYRINLENRLPGIAGPLEALFEEGKQHPPANWSVGKYRIWIDHYRNLVTSSLQSD